MVSADTWRRLRQDFISFHFLFFFFLAYVVFSFLLSLHFPMPYITINLLLQGRQTQTDRFALATGLGPSISATNHFCFLFSQISLHPMTSARHARRASATQKCTAFKSTAYRMHVCFSPFVLVQTPMSGYACESVTDACKVHVHGVSGGHISAAKRVVRARAGYYVCIICMVLLTKRGTGRGGFHDFIRRGKGEHVGWKGGRGGCLLAQS